jgi:hypothetical protein
MWVEEYKTKSGPGSPRGQPAWGGGIDWVILQTQALGAETGPGRYRFRFRIPLALLAVSSQTS